MGFNFMRHVELVLGISVVLSSSALRAAEAPRGNAWAATWSSGNKEAYGTAYEAYDSEGNYSSSSATAPLSKVWFTSAQGVATEIFWPTLDRKQLRDLQFLVSDGKSFFFEERTQGVSRVEWLEKGVPAYRVTTRDPGGRFEIEKIFFTDPSRDVFYMKTRFRALRDGLKLYVLVNPAMANTPYGDRARVDASSLTAWQDNDALAVVADVPFAKTSAGFSGSLDPYQDLARDLSFDQSYDTATDGDVVMMAELALPATAGDHDFDVALGFGDTAHQARNVARAGLTQVDEALSLFARQWKAYQATISEPKLGARPGRNAALSSDLFRGSVAVLKSLEDKTFPGAFVASPSVPWGVLKYDESSRASPRWTQMTDHELPSHLVAQGTGAYHLVWPRDLYQMAESFIALGDVASAKASLRYLQKIQYTDNDGTWDYGRRRFSKKGSFLQNSWLHGEVHWKQLQIDQTSYPILLAAKLWRMGAVDFEEIRELITTAADFIEANGPWTFQERWEENMGVAPSTLAVQIRAMREASEVFGLMKDAARSARYAARAAQWARDIETWTFTTSGTQAGGRYYLRIVGSSFPDAEWNPNSFARIQITNGGAALLEKSVIDGGFLELVRYGVRDAWNGFVRSTVDAYDATLAFNTNRGVGFKRYTGDRYNWDERNFQQTDGMIWPFLSGERAAYELAALKERQDKMSGEGADTIYNQKVLSHMQAFENFATPSGMFPEQVWDSGARQGLPTGAATPLGWAHGEYVRMIREMENFESRSLTAPKR
jgi:glucoamylase